MFCIQRIFREQYGTFIPNSNWNLNYLENLIRVAHLRGLVVNRPDCHTEIHVSILDNPAVSVVWTTTIIGLAPNSVTVRIVAKHKGVNHPHYYHL